MPRNPCGVSGGLFTHATAPLRSGKSPSTGRSSPAAFFESFAAMRIAPAAIMPPPCIAGRGCTLSSKLCSMREVLANDNCVNSPVSHPNPMTTTAARTATPRPRRTHSPAPRDFFSAANTRPPMRSASANEVAAPAAYMSNRTVVRALAPWIAAPVRIRPRIGPAHGAHKKPVAIPRTKDVTITPRALPPADADSDKRFPNATTGLIKWSARDGNSSSTPNTASRIIAPTRPNSFARTTQPPPTAASVATAANVNAMPTSMGSTLRTNGCPARAKTNGNTGRTHGLRIVNTPPKYASRNRIKGTPDIASAGAILRYICPDTAKIAPRVRTMNASQIDAAALTTFEVDPDGAQQSF